MPVEIKTQPAPSIDRVGARLNKLEPDVRQTILGWMSERDLGSETARLEYIGDAVMAIRASLRCGNKCCAGKSREERLENAK